MKFPRVFNAFSLKTIMLALMILDHIYYYLFPVELLPAHYIARVVAPVFAFLVSQSMLYTRDRLRYILRLCAAGAVMAAGNTVIAELTGIRITNNIFLSLAVGAMLVHCIDAFKGRNRSLLLVSCAALAIASFFCEGGYQIPIAVLIFYYLRNNRAMMYLTYILLSGLPYFIIFTNTGHMLPQGYMIFAVLPIMLYNGERGPKSAFAKYFFYIIYPLHIWIIVAVQYFFF